MWVEPYWEEEARKLDELIDGAMHYGLNWDFLHRGGGALGGLVTTDMNLMAHECAYLLTRYEPEQLKEYLSPTVNLLRSVPTSVHHLYLFTKWREKVGEKKIDCVIEWGGGYGDMAVIIKTIHPNIHYVIVDLPPAIRLQRLYIPERIDVAYAESPLRHDLPDCELFISTYGLSESGLDAQNYVVQKQYFHARHLLLAYEPDKIDLFPSTPNFLSGLPHRGEPALAQPGSEYLFT